MPLTTLFAICILSLTGAGEKHVAPQVRIKATFELDVKKSEVMKPGKSTLVCANAFAVVMRRQGRFKFQGVDIFFAPRSADGRAPRNAKEIRRGDYANVNLMTDSTGRVTAYFINLRTITIKRLERHQ